MLAELATTSFKSKRLVRRSYRALTFSDHKYRAGLAKDLSLWFNSPNSYRTSSGAEIDLILELPIQQGPWAIEIKRSLTPKIEKGFHIACEEIKPHRRFLVYPGGDKYPLGGETKVIDLKLLVSMLAKMQ